MAMVAHQPLTEPSVDAGKHLHKIHSMGDHDARQSPRPRKKMWGFLAILMMFYQSF